METSLATNPITLSPVGSTPLGGCRCLLSPLPISKQMNIAIDFDGTWSRDPGCFIQLTHLLQEKNHRVFIVTRRVQSDGIHLNQIPTNVKVIYCNGEFKRLHCEKLGLKIDIWIDDEPGTIEPQRIPNPCPDSLL